MTSEMDERERRVVECFASEHAAVATPPASHDAVEAVTQGFPDLLHEAGEIVRGKFVWKRFISGTPLDNDVPVWMAEFALSHIATLRAQLAGAEGRLHEVAVACATAEQKLAASEARGVVLEKSLRHYGTHSDHCEKSRFVNPSVCTCGYEAAIGSASHD